jgi:hypothetical protein
MVTNETRHAMTDPARSVIHYRARAYGDTLLIIVLAVVSYFIVMKVDVIHYVVTWMYEARTRGLDALFAVSLFLLVGSLVFILRRRTELLDEIRQREKLEVEQAHSISQLEDALSHVRTLSGLLPICAWCKKIRDDQGYWTQVEAYLQSHTNAEFTHGICPECAANFNNAPESKSRE